MPLFTARIDRPLGSCHPRHPEMVYPVNYGFIPGIIAGDGAEQDVYILGVNEPVEAFTGELTAVVHRRNDVEEKWVLTPPDVRFTAEEIRTQILFQEQYFDSVVLPGALPIVRAAASLEDAALRIRLDCLREVCSLPDDHAFSPEFCETTRQFLRTGDQTTLLAMDGDVPVACATLCYVRYIPTCGHPTGKRAHLMNVYTAPGNRRQGLARRLITLLHNEAAERGVTEISLDATDEGRRLYERLGYQASDEAMTFDVGR